MEETRKVFCYTQEADQEFMAALWQDVQSNAQVLGIKGFVWEIIERNLDDQTISYRTEYEVYYSKALKTYFRWRRWRQEYNAVGLHNYRGCVEISVDINLSTTELQDALSTLCYGSYYRRIAEFYPDFVTHYIDSPKEVI